MRLGKVARKIMKNPSLISKVLLPYVKNDIRAMCGSYNYDHHVLFIAGLPKSGTTWLHRLLLKIPGYNNRFYNDLGRVTEDHDVCETIFSSLPRSRYSVIKLHTRYSEENYRIITKYVSKFVVIYRDLRDMCVSRYHHVIADRTHRHHELYNSVSQEEGMAHCIDLVGEEYTPWVRDWVTIASQSKDVILVVTYEALNMDTQTTMKRVMDFFRIPYDARLLQSMELSKISIERSLEVELSNVSATGMRNTARKGIVGDWKNHFTDEHKAQFKRVAGDILIQLGYERDINW